MDYETAMCQAGEITDALGKLTLQTKRIADLLESIIDPAQGKFQAELRICQRGND